MNKYSLLLCFLISACATIPDREWEQQAGSQADLYQTKFNCLQQSQQPYSKQHLDNFGTFKGNSEEGVKTNKRLFNTCMNAHGFFLILR